MQAGPGEVISQHAAARQPETLSVRSILQLQFKCASLLQVKDRERGSGAGSAEALAARAAQGRACGAAAGAYADCSCCVNVQHQRAPQLSRNMAVCTDGAQSFALPSSEYCTPCTVVGPPARIAHQTATPTEIGSPLAHRRASTTTSGAPTGASQLPASCTAWRTPCTWTTTACCGAHFLALFATK